MYFCAQAKQWIANFVAVSSVAQGDQKQRVTPYMHITAMHVHEIVRC